MHWLRQQQKDITRVLGIWSLKVKTLFLIPLAGPLHAAGYKSDLRRHRQSEKSQWRRKFSILDFISFHLIRLHPIWPADAIVLKIWIRMSRWTWLWMGVASNNNALLSSNSNSWKTSVCLKMSNCSVSVYSAYILWILKETSRLKNSLLLSCTNIQPIWTLAPNLKDAFSSHGNIKALVWDIIKLLLWSNTSI